MCPVDQLCQTANQLGLSHFFFTTEKEMQILLKPKTRKKVTIPSKVTPLGTRLLFLSKEEIAPKNKVCGQKQSALIAYACVSAQTTFGKTILTSLYFIKRKSFSDFKIYSKFIIIHKIPKHQKKVEIVCEKYLKTIWESPWMTVQTDCTLLPISQIRPHSCTLKTRKPSSKQKNSTKSRQVT